ncbi:MAG: fructosamine kinase family protein [bacterium]
MADWNQIANEIASASGRPFNPQSPSTQSGGCINTAVTLCDGKQEWFVKLNSANRLDMFEAESAGLQALANTRAIRIPRPLCTGISAGSAFIVMEKLHLGSGNRDGQAKAAQQLAAMHGHSAEAFGWDRDNTIGATPQQNDWSEHWVDFWREHRLGYQLELAARNGYGLDVLDQGNRLKETFSALIDHKPAPSLLHGDLWGGNLGFDEQGEPVIYDPATYYGDREAEIAMTELFGGFSSDFYKAYDAAWSLDPGYGVRKDLYNLYHVLNHLNLFGTGYLGQAQRLIARLLSALGV